MCTLCGMRHAACGMRHAACGTITEPTTTVTSRAWDQKGQVCESRDGEKQDTATRARDRRGGRCTPLAHIKPVPFLRFRFESMDCARPNRSRNQFVSRSTDSSMLQLRETKRATLPHLVNGAALSFIVSFYGRQRSYALLLPAASFTVIVLSAV